MSDPTTPIVDLEQIEEDERREKIRNRVLIALIALIGFAVAGWVGAVVDDAQENTTKAKAGQEQAQVEKFNLAQQIAAACKDPANGLDEATAARLCKDAATIVREGPQGAQGLPGAQGVQGTQGLQGIQGFQGTPGKNGKDGTNGTDGTDGEPGGVGPAGTNGTDGAEGPAGPAGKDGQDGAVGPAGPAGKDGQPPVSWVVYGPNETVIERCVRSDDFDPDSPTYTCTRDPGPPQ